MATIEDLYLPYPDFKLQEIIDPEQFDINNEYTVIKMNEVLSILNQLINSTTDGESGADLVNLTPITGFVSIKLQAFLEEIIAKLESSTGSTIIGTPLNEGVSGTNVNAQLRSLKVLLDTQLARLMDNEEVVKGALEISRGNTITAGNALEVALDVKKDFDAIIKSSNGGVAEVVVARGGFDTLGDRLDDYLANIDGGHFGYVETEVRVDGGTF